MIMSPFFPGAAIKKGVTQTQVGIIFSLEPIASFFSCMAVGTSMKRVGYRKLLLLGMFMLLGGTLMFFFLQFVNDGTAFFYLSCISRVLQGVGAAIAVSVCYGFVA